VIVDSVELLYSRITAQRIGGAYLHHVRRQPHRADTPAIGEIDGEGLVLPRPDINHRGCCPRGAQLAVSA
jgi:hypothetical protein